MSLCLLQSLPMRNLLFILVFSLATLAAAALDRKDVEFTRSGGKPVLLYLHVPDGPGPFPAAILVHGGGFDEGSRSINVRPLFDVLAGAGYAWFSIDYRMAPEFRFPHAIKDVVSAIKWVKANAATYHVDVTKIALIGESAGAFLVNYAGTHETPQTRVRAVVDIYGPVDYGKLAGGGGDSPGPFQHPHNHPPRRQRRRHPFLWRRTTRRGGHGEASRRLADLRRPPRNAAVPVHSRGQGRSGVVPTIPGDVRRHEEGGSEL